MSDKIEEIRARYAGYSLNSGNAGKANEDRGWLLAEVDRQRAEIEQLRAGIQSLAESLRASLDAAIRQRDEARAEIERLRAENEKQRAEIERMRDVLRRVVVYPSGDRAARVAFVSVGCQVSFPLHPQTTWALELLVEFDQARRAALDGKP